MSQNKNKNHTDSVGVRIGSILPATKPILILAALVIVSLLIGNHEFDSLREGLKKEAQRDIVAVGILKAEQINEWMDDRVSDAGTLSDNSFFSREITNWIREGARDQIKRGLIINRLESVLKVHHYLAILVFDSTGKLLIDVGDTIPDVKELGGEARSAVNSRRLKFIDLHHPLKNETTTGLGFMSPMREGEIYTGAIYLAEDPQRYLFPLMQSWPGGSETAETQLVRAEGNKVLYLDQLRYRDEPPLGFKLPLDSTGLLAAIALQGKQGLIEHAHDYRGKPVLSFAIEIKETPWVLISKIDEEEAYQLEEKLRRMSGYLMLFIVGLMGALFWQWHRRNQVAADTAILKERLRGESLQMEAEKRFRIVFEGTALPMLRSSISGELIEVNSAWCNMFGYSRNEVALQHLTWQQITHPVDLESSASIVNRTLSGEIDDFKIEKRYIHKDGKVLWGSVQVKLLRNQAGEPDFFIVAIQDVTERKQTENKINFMAYHDKLTGLPNRALLFDRLSQAMSQAKRDSKHVALLFVDLDGFKVINDKYGHEAGDAVLRMAAQRFLACVRAADTVSRFGGDEFAIILGSLDDPQQAKGVAEKIVHAFAHNLILADGSECYVGASVGISIYPENGTAMDNLMTAADQAMYESKRSGKNTFTFYNEKAPLNSGSQWFKFEVNHEVGVMEIDEQHRNLVYMVNRLNDALKHDESSESVLQMLDELLVATEHHFETERRYMIKYQYNEQDVHENEHSRLVNEAQHFREQFNQGRELLVLQSIKDWLLGHIVYTDKKLGSFLKQQGVK